MSFYYHEIEFERHQVKEDTRPVPERRHYTVRLRAVLECGGVSWTWCRCVWVPRRQSAYRVWGRCVCCGQDLQRPFPFRSKPLASALRGARRRRPCAHAHAARTPPRATYHAACIPRPYRIRHRQDLLDLPHSPATCSQPPPTLPSRTPQNLTPRRRRRRRHPRDRNPGPQPCSIGPPRSQPPPMSYRVGGGKV